MRIGISVPHYGDFTSPEANIEVSQAAEAMGFQSLWTGDRILAPLKPSEGYGGMSPDVPMPEQFKTYLDPLIALTFAAAHTDRMRLGMSTLNAPWYSPVLLARALTSLDVLSKGRVDAGFGISWLRDEYTAVNVPFAARGARLDETLDVLEKIWTQKVIEHQGPNFTIVPTTLEPKPVQQPRPPILLAGFAPTALRRIGRRADGWLAGPMPLPFLAGLWQTIQAEAEQAGRDPGSLRGVLRINVRLTDTTMPEDRMHEAGTLEQFVSYAREAFTVGMDEVFIDLAHTCTSTDQLLDVAERFITALRDD